jgi:hypothetical protein
MIGLAGMAAAAAVVSAAGLPLMAPYKRFRSYGESSSA